VTVPHVAMTQVAWGSVGLPNAGPVRARKDRKPFSSKDLGAPRGAANGPSSCSACSAGGTMKTK
jgi:hypothetical protein